jgi:hypothetical protein
LFQINSDESITDKIDYFSVHLPYRKWVKKHWLIFYDMNGDIFQDGKIIEEVGME